MIYIFPIWCQKNIMTDEIKPLLLSEKNNEFSLNRDLIWSWCVVLGSTDIFGQESQLPFIGRGPTSKGEPSGDADAWA
jgi:hypothetical protein